MLNDNFKKVCLGLFASILLLSQQTVFADETLDKIAAIVNEEVVTQGEYRKALHVATLDLQHAGGHVSDKKVFEKQVLKQLIDKKLQLQTAKQAGIKVTEKDIDKAVRSIAMQNHLSVADFYNRISQEGFSKSDYRREMKEQMLIQRLQEQQISSKIKVSPEEINQFLKMQHLRHPSSSEKEYSVIDILISLSDNPSQEELSAAKENASTLIKQIKEGKSLQVALKNAGADATDLGWRKLNDFPSLFVKNIGSLKVNEVSPPIEASNGLHVLQLVDARVISSNDTTLTRQEAERAVMQNKIIDQIQQMVSKLRSQSYIEIV